MCAYVRAFICSRHAAGDVDYFSISRDAAFRLLIHYADDMRDAATLFDTLCRFDATPP